MKINKDNLVFRVTPIHQRAWEGSLHSTYTLWKAVWSDTFRELQGTEQIHSDAFAFSDEVGAIYYENAPIGLVLYKWWDFSSPLSRDHSYFKIYPTGTLEKLISSESPPLMTMSYLTVHPEWRKSITSIPVSEILIGLAVKRFLSSKSHQLLAYTRNDRKINDLVYRYGATPLVTNQRAHNVAVDLISIARENAKPSSLEGVSDLVDALWENRNLKETHKTIKAA